MAGERIVILGAAGRDFHDFNVVYRDDPSVIVVAFTAAQIPGIAGRRYPPSLAGPRYPRGIPIEIESDLEALCRREGVTQVVFTYSDVSHAQVMRLGSRALAVGADFVLLGPARTMLRAAVPVHRGFRCPHRLWQVPDRALARPAIAAARSTDRRHPSSDAVRGPGAPACAALRDARRPRRRGGAPSKSGRNTSRTSRPATWSSRVDYAEIAALAVRETDLIVWDGGNNDFPFLHPDLHIVVADALRPNDGRGYHPGEAVLQTADVIVVNKVDAATPAQVERAVEVARAVNARAPLVRAASPVRLDNPGAVRGRRVVVVEDGPTLTHGSMPYGAGLVAARAAGAVVVDPWPAATPVIQDVRAQHPHIGPVLPAVGYSAAQLDALRETLERVNADVVVAATPVDLARLIAVSKPIVRARYEFADAGEPPLGGLVDAWLARSGAGEGSKGLEPDVQRIWCLETRRWKVLRSMPAAFAAEEMLPP